MTEIIKTFMGKFKSGYTEADIYLQSKAVIF